MQFAAESSSLEMLWSTGLRKLLDDIAFHTGKQSIGLQNMKELIQVCMVDGDTRPSTQKRRLIWNNRFSSCGKQVQCRQFTFINSLNLKRSHNHNTVFG
eukprot:g5059.t1